MTKNRYKKAVVEKSLCVKYQIEKRKCERCSAKFNGTRYQKWCASCRDILNKIEWDWCLWN